MKRINSICLLLLLLSATACQKALHGDTDGTEKTFDLTIRFKAVVDNEPLQFNTAYKNISGEAYAVSTFKYYIYQISLLDSAAGTSLPAGANAYYLIDAADTGTGAVSFRAAAQPYNRIAFTIGVDSASNVSGAQTGALDPAKGMFWTWNSGYIMAKLEGNSPLSAQPNNKFEYHIGGFRQPYSVIKRIVLTFPPGQALSTTPGATNNITISANINAWFNGATPLRIASNPVCMTPGALAAGIAENYSGMFTVMEIAHN